MADETPDLRLTAAACARRTGLTVRALRVYERHGLVRPVRNQKGWRHYGRVDLERLTAVATLKSLGLSLREIGRVLRGEPDLKGLLQARIQAWIELAERAREGLALARNALAIIESGRTVSTDVLCDLTRSMTMNEMPQSLIDAANAMYSKEEQEAILARKMAMADDPTTGQAAWSGLIEDIRRLISDGVDPASPAALAAAIRWRDLVAAFTGGDPAIEAKGRSFWERALDQDPSGDALPFGKDEWEFVGRALRAAK